MLLQVQCLREKAELELARAKAASDEATRRLHYLNAGIYFDRFFRTGSHQEKECSLP